MYLISFIIVPLLIFLFCYEYHRTYDKIILQCIISILEHPDGNWFQACRYNLDQRLLLNLLSPLMMITLYLVVILH